jgi:uncharacterized lipoprotein YajG
MKYLLTVILGVLLLAGCNLNPTTSNSAPVVDCRNFAPPNCLVRTVSANRTQEANGAPDAYRYCYCLNTERTEVLQ